MIIKIEENNGSFTCSEFDSGMNLRLGEFLYCTERQQFVEPGKRPGTYRKKPRHNTYWSSIVSSVKNGYGSMTIEDLTESFIRSDDVLTASDLAAWEEQRDSFLFLKSNNLI